MESNRSTPPPPNEATAARPPNGTAPSKPRRRRWIAGGLIVLVAVIGTWAILGAGSSTNADLDEAQWQRILGQFSQAARSAQETAASALGGSEGGSSGEADQSVDAAGPPDEAAAPAATDDPLPLPQAQRLPPPEPDPAVLAAQAQDYEASRPKSILDLQRYRDTVSIEIRDGGGRQGTATLINLNPQINTWYLLRLQWSGEDTPRSYHLTNPAPAAQTLVLDAEFPYGLLLASTLDTATCDLWSVDNGQRLETAAGRNTPYVMLCDDRVALRLTTTGRRTTMERTTDFLRDSIWGGEAITVFVRETFFQDAHLSTAELAGASARRSAQAAGGDSPRPARVAPAAAGQLLDRLDLGLTTEGSDRGRLAVGEWYPLAGNRGVFASTIRPDLVAPEILQSHTDVVTRLDAVEAGALAYLVAFDLGEFEVAFSLGTDHPRLGWSERVPEERRDASLPGPDGIDSRAPLVSTGIISGALAGRATATFTGGFKRTHGAFRYGDLAMTNNGSHYGFIEEGVVFSKLRPGLATMYVLDDGQLEMKTWDRDDDWLLPRIRHARQNGVPIIERDPPASEGVPGAFVSRFGAGNWSGSQDGNFRALRAGTCLQETADRRFLIYAYFSSATPSAMARIFQAYGCSYAMLLDMNALEHTYMAVYTLRGSELHVEHLVRGMEVLDRSEAGRLLPRFLGYADNRDFFSMLRRTPGGVPVEEDGQ